MKPDLVEVLENIKNSVFHHHMITGLIMIDGLNKRNGYQTPRNIFALMFTKEHVVGPYLENLKQLIVQASSVQIMQNFFQIDDEHWRDDIAPRIGSLRIGSTCLQSIAGCISKPKVVITDLL